MFQYCNVAFHLCMDVKINMMVNREQKITVNKMYH